MHNAWIVGSAANLDNENPRDYDVLVPFSNWSTASTLIPRSAIPNIFGGWKFIDEGKVKGVFDTIVDVWPGDLSEFLTIDMVKFIWHPRTNRRFKL